MENNKEVILNHLDLYLFGYHDNEVIKVAANHNGQELTVDFKAIEGNNTEEKLVNLFRDCNANGFTDPVLVMYPQGEEAATKEAEKLIELGIDIVEMMVNNTLEHSLLCPLYNNEIFDEYKEKAAM
jgi:hypothetical protein